jgi:hypothetical protein
MRNQFLVKAGLMQQNYTCNISCRLLQGYYFVKTRSAAIQATSVTAAFPSATAKAHTTPHQGPVYHHVTNKYLPLLIET